MKILLTAILIIFGNLVFSQNEVNLKTYINSDYNNIDTLYNVSGVTETVKYYKDDVLSTQLSFFEDGKIKSIINYNLNKAYDGKVVFWYLNGQKHMETIYENGLPINESNYTWYENGVIESNTKCYERGNCTTSFFYESGVIKKIVKSKAINEYYVEKRCENGQVTSIEYINPFAGEYKEYHCNGKVKIIASKNKNGAYIGEYRQWFNDGQLEEIRNYSDTDGYKSLKEGEWKYYNKAGEYILYELYSNGKLLEQKHNPN